MRCSLTAVAALLPAAQAVIQGFAVPETIKPGEPFNLEIQRFNYIQAVYDVAFAVGSTPGSGYPQSLGYEPESFYIGPNESNKVGNLTKQVTVPATIAPGQGIISVSVMSLWGAVASPQLTNYNVTVTFGSETSTTYVSSISNQ